MLAAGGLYPAWVLGCATVCLFLREQHLVVGALLNFMLPTMHQCLELLVKALVMTTDPTFDPEKKKYQHDTWEIVKDYANRVLCFRELLQNMQVQRLFKELKESYFTVRYGEGVHSCDGEAWDLFCSTADMLFDALRNVTCLPFPVGPISEL